MSRAGQGPPHRARDGARDGVPMKWTDYPLRKCNSMHACAYTNCGQPDRTIRLGQRYYDGGYGRRAHEACAQDFELVERGLNHVEPSPKRPSDCPPCAAGGARQGEHIWPAPPECTRPMLIATCVAVGIDPLSTQGQAMTEIRRLVDIRAAASEHVRNVDVKLKRGRASAAEVRLSRLLRGPTPDPAADHCGVCAHTRGQHSEDEGWACYAPGCKCAYFAAFHEGSP